MRTLRPQTLDARSLTGAVLAALAPGLALGGPTGEQVVGGSATVGRPDALTTVVTQQTHRAIIDWQSFDVGGQELVLFQQPSSSAVVLNRVIGGTASEIFGRIEANGRVFLINPQGVMFAPGAQLDVGGLVATTFAIDDQAFMAGSNTFVRAAGAPDAGVVNRGVIRTADGGFVVLAGDFVRNEGVVAAANGSVVLAAGGRIALNLDGAGLVDYAVDEPTLSAAAGVSNTGLLLADGGTVVMTARVANALIGTAVNNEGLVQARRIEDRGGEVWLAASGGDVANAGSVDASGLDGDGGRAIVYSDRDVALTGTVRADGADGGAGGEVRAIALGTLTVADGARISARGGAGTVAAGGMVEVSGHGALHLRGAIDVGTGGAILIDPAVVTLTAGSAAPSVAGVITTGFISAQLQLGNDVKIIASSSIGASTAGLSIVSNNVNGDLMLEIGTTAPGCSILGAAGFCVDPPGFPVVTLTSGGTIALSGLDIDIAGVLRVDASAGAIQLGNVDASAIDIGGSLARYGTLDAAQLFAGNGDVTLFGAGDTLIVTSVGAALGAVVIDLEDGTGSGISLNAGAIIAGGALDVSAHAASGGAFINVGGLVSAGGAATVTADAGAGRAALSLSGGVTATGAVLLRARDIGGASPNTEVFVGGNLTGQAVTVLAESSYQGGNVLVGGDVVATGGPIDITGRGVGAGLPGGLVNVNGTVTATGTAGDVTVTASDAGGAGGGVITLGGVSGADVSLTAFGSGAGSGGGGGQILIGTGSGSSFLGGDVNATGDLTLLAHGDNAGAGMVVAGTTTVGGSITVDAKGPGPNRVWFAAVLGSASVGSVAAVTAAGGISLNGVGGLDLAGDFTAASIDVVTDGQALTSLATFDTPDLLLDGAAGATDFTVVTDANAITIDGADAVVIDNAAGTAALTLTLVGTSPTTLDLATGGSLTLSGTFSGNSLALDAAGIDLGAGAHSATSTMSLVTSGALTGTGVLFAGGLMIDGAATTDVDLTLDALSVSVLEARDLTLDVSGAAGGGVTFSLGGAVFGDVRLMSGGDLFLNTSVQAQSLLLDALGDVNTGSTTTIMTDALLVQANGNVNMMMTSVSLGDGDGTLGVSDQLLLAGLRSVGLGPTQSVSNGAFLAGGTLSLGSVTSAGDYLVLQGDLLNLNGSISGPSGLVVQIAPATPGSVIAIEDGGVVGPAGAALATTYTASGHFGQISPATIVIGSSTYTGDVLIGLGGSVSNTVDVTPHNLIIATSGTIDRLGNVATTGMVASLAELLRGLVVTGDPPAIVTEIDPALADPRDPVDTEAGAVEDDEDDEDREGEDTDAEGDGAADDDAGLITQETAPAAGICRK